MATATTYTSNYQIKLIGDSREAGTWGVSTNENLKRIEDAMGATVSIDLSAMPTGSTNATVGTSWTATWLTLDASDSGESGSEGRSQFVEVNTDTIAAAQNMILNIRGSNSSEVPARIITIFNNITSPYTLTIDANGTDYVIRNGNYAVLALLPAAAGNITSGVHNLNNSVQMDGGIDFNSAADVNFSGGSNTITFPDSQAAALTATDGTNDYLRFDTSNDLLEFLQNVSSRDKGPFTWQLDEAETSAFLFQAFGGTNFLRFDTTNADVEVLQRLRIATGKIDTTGQATDIEVIDNNANALEIKAGAAGTTVLNIDTTNFAESVDVTGDLTATGALTVTGAATAASLDAGSGTVQTTGSGSFGATTVTSLDSSGTVEALRVTLSETPDSYFNASTTGGSTGYGFRNNSGSMEAKNNGGDWSSIITALTTASAAATAGDNVKVVFDIGPVRVVIDTVTLSGGVGTKGPFTLSDMNSTIYTVFGCLSHSGGTDQAASVWVSSAASRQIDIKNNSNFACTFTYCAIGDSGN